VPQEKVEFKASNGLGTDSFGKSQGSLLGFVQTALAFIAMDSMDVKIFDWILVRPKLGWNR